MIALFFAGLACFSKQSGLLVFLVVIAFCLGARRKWWVYSPLIFWGGVAVFLVVATHGWALEYLIRYPSAHGFRLALPNEIVIRFFGFQILLWISLFTFFVNNRKERRFTIFILAVIISSLAGIVKNGGYFSSLFPVEPLLCIAGARWLYSRKILLACQLLLGLYNPFHALYPWYSYHRADDTIVEIARQASGDVWIPMESYLYPRTGKNEWDNFCAHITLLWSGVPAPKRLLDALAAGRFEYILIRKNSMEKFNLFDPGILRLISGNYVLNRDGEVVVFTRKKGAADMQ
jgi:hypothetical protein